ncbi:MAG: AI-2E family transporter [Sterolibacterium sp.]|nr:AI-2E family transporter [Sterolibacterium sp.]
MANNNLRNGTLAVSLAVSLAVPLAAILLHLVPALLAGLLIHTLVSSLAPRLEHRLTSHGARVATVALMAILIIAAVGALTIGAIAFIHSDAGSLPALMQKMADILESTRSWLPAWAIASLPANSSELQSDAATWLRTHAGELQNVGKETLRAFAHALIGMLIGALVVLRKIDAKGTPPGLLANELGSHAARFAAAFRQVVFAQVQIAAINASLTGLYLVVGLSLFGIHLPLAKTMVVFTFVVGLLPIVGNLFSNTVIVVLSLSHSPNLALLSLVFLVLVHKLEYFLNARIVGNLIQARTWELLLAMLVMEATFGIAGLVMAPIYYAYLKNELELRGWL